jgi:hydroxyacylglutathione hydrolase
MEIISYQSPLPRHSIAKGSFVDRNPNLSHLVISADKHCALIDACSDSEAVLRDLNERRLHLDCLLITHDHGDHTFALTDWMRRFPDLPVGIHASSFCALTAKGVNKPFPLQDGTVLKVGSEDLRVMETPGHTNDSLCFWDEKGHNLLTGDVIFGGNIGCSDYRNGGNRNIFYQTILRLLNILPPSTNLYPGHLSEHYRTPPPYGLAAEKINNPYLANALAGKRGNFDRALKIFSQEFETAEVVMLDESAFDELQASRDVIRERLQSGHRLLSVKEEAGLVGMLGWCYSSFSLEEGAACFPGNFRQFSNCSSCDPRTARSAFIYNLGIKPAARRKGAGSLLLQEAFEKMRRDGIFQVFIDSRLPSYNGSGQDPQERILRNREFAEAVDRYFTTGRFPAEQIFRLDPAVSFYMKNGPSPWLIVRDFIRDEPSGDMRVICYLNLDQDRPL